MRAAPIAAFGRLMVRRHEMVAGFVFMVE